VLTGDGIGISLSICDINPWGTVGDGEERVESSVGDAEGHGEALSSGRADSSARDVEGHGAPGTDNIEAGAETATGGAALRVTLLA